MKYPVDTYKLVTHLEKNGFTKPQSVTLIKSISALVSKKMENLRETTVTKEEQDMENYNYKLSLLSLKVKIFIFFDYRMNSRH
jgi:hypothetical protein